MNLTDIEKHVYDLIARRFIAVFYPDCKFATTTVMGKVEKVDFKVSGKTILDEGWRAVYGKGQQGGAAGNGDNDINESQDNPDKAQAEERTLPVFVKGESGEHVPSLAEKWTTPPKFYTEATLLRAMETAGKFVDNDELRAALKENGIGRPSSRASIIETLFKRHYIKRERKNLIATPTGIELIDLIREELLKSCELTGIWEKKLRDIEHRKYDAGQFIEELKGQINEIVRDVLADNTNRRVTVLTEQDLKKKMAPKAKAAPKAEEPATRTEGPATRTEDPATKSPGTVAAAHNGAQGGNGAQTGDAIVGQKCPLCGQGVIIKGKTAYGCSRWKEGCRFRKPL